MDIKSEIQNPKAKLWLLFIVLIIAAFLRLYNITETPPGFYPDEAIYANNGVEAWETGPPAGGLKVFYPENNGREGLWPNIIGFFIVRFGHEPWAPRSIAAIFGILTVLGVYFLARELFRNYELGIRNQGNKILNHNSLFIIHDSEKIALLSSFFLAVSFWHINFSRIGFRAIMAPFFLVWGIYFLLKSLNKINFGDLVKPKKVQLIGLCLVGGILYGFGFHSYIAYRATPLLILAILFFYWLSDKEKEVRKKILLIAVLFSFSALVVFSPLGLYFLQNPQDFFGRTTQISIFNSPTPLKDLGMNILKTAGMFNFVGDFNWRHNYAARPELFWPVGIMFLIGVGVLIRTKTGGGFLANLIIFFWLVITALSVVISNEGLPHALRAILMAPPVFILAGFGGLWLYESIKNTITRDSIAKVKMLNIFVFIFLSLLVFEAYNTYFVKWAKNPNTAGAFSADYVKIGRELNSLPKELPKYVVVEASGVDVRGIPMPAQTVMFITDTFTPEKQKEKNIYYVLPKEIDKIPENSYTTVLR